MHFSRLWIHRGLRFHLLMALATVGTGTVSFVSLQTGFVRVAPVGPILFGVFVLVAMLSPLPAWHHQQGRELERDAALAIPWAFILSTLLTITFYTAGRTGFPLRDSLFRSLDHLVGYDSTAVTAWAGRVGIASPMEHCYYLLQPLMLVALLLPALTGKRGARIFLLANLVALPIVGILYTLLPAVGPWYPNHFVPGIMQLQCQEDVLRLRATGVAQGVGIVCFPSCHVLWAVFCSAALWDFRWLRIPVAIFAGLIIVSTLTTGWHYLVDVIAGLLLAWFSLAMAGRLDS